MGRQRLGTLQQTNLINAMDTSIIKPGTRWAIMYGNSVIHIYVEAIFEDHVMWCEERWFCPVRSIENLERFSLRDAILLPSKRKPWWQRVWQLWLGSMD